MTEASTPLGNLPLNRNRRHVGSGANDAIREAIRRNEEEVGVAAALSPSHSRSSEDLRSHFQYILCNLTEAIIIYSQTQTANLRTLEPGQEVSFSFSNPYQPKLLEISLDGWSRTVPFPIDAPGARSSLPVHSHCHHPIGSSDTLCAQAQPRYRSAHSSLVARICREQTSPFPSLFLPLHQRFASTPPFRLHLMLLVVPSASHVHCRSIRHATNTTCPRVCSVACLLASAAASSRWASASVRFVLSALSIYLFKSHHL